MKDLELTQSDLRKLVYGIEFEGSPKKFEEVGFGYCVSYQQDVFPNKWEFIKGKPVIYLKRMVGGYELSIDILASPLPNGRSKLQIFITSYKHEESIEIVKKFVDYLRKDGWIKPEDKKKLSKLNEERIKVFVEKKKQNPSLTQEKLAIEVNFEYDDYINGDTVRNTYRATKTPWVRGDRNY